MGLPGSLGAQRGDFRRTWRSPRGGEGPPTFSEPGKRDEGSRGPRRTLRRFSEDRRHVQQRLIEWFWRKQKVMLVMDPPAAHREPVGFIFPHSDVGTSERHPETQRAPSPTEPGTAGQKCLTCAGELSLLTLNPGNVSLSSYQRRRSDCQDRLDSCLDSYQKPELKQTSDYKLGAETCDSLFKVSYRCVYNTHYQNCVFTILNCFVSSFPVPFMAPIIINIS